MVFREMRIGIGMFFDTTDRGRNEDESGVYKNHTEFNQGHSSEENHHHINIALPLHLQSIWLVREGITKSCNWPPGIRKTNFCTRYVCLGMLACAITTKVLRILAAIDIAQPES